MLITYKQSHKKIAMGLISYMPSEKDLKKLQQTMKRYESDESWKLFLWKVDDIVGVVGIQQLDNGSFQLQHLSVNPSFRDEGIGTRMLQALKDKIKGEIVPNKDTIDFYESCQHELEKES
ncbi:GNAT family N-acetyltransferase [Bacillus sp. FJAT-45350]|uniref:GNAT family N-acetyltransferase n=1 Tax=Bacillus sp. FJAT-45350 TaxID=2011014 RepID=UPI000BB68DF3|nr:GNAT family N-acetyltransferase [Bacillus sp. FJAT-45350]